MAIACTVKDYLSQHRIAYEVLPHSHTMTSLGSGEAAGVHADRLAKAVVLEDELGYLMAVLPASHHLKLGSLQEQPDIYFEAGDHEQLVHLSGKDRKSTRLNSSHQKISYAV